MGAILPFSSGLQQAPATTAGPTAWVQPGLIPENLISDADQLWSVHDN